MKVLLVGGAGGVGTFVTPYLARVHDIRVLDLRPPAAPGIEHVIGSITDPAALREALQGVDVVIDLCMKSPQGGRTTEQNLQQIVDNYEVNTLGLHLLLWTAQQLGVRRAIYTSTLSVHYRERVWYPMEESVPLDSPSVYGLTKGLGENICEYFARWFDMNILALRITGPRTREDYLAERVKPAKAWLKITDAEDLARAYLAAIDATGEGHGRFDAVWIAGDEREQELNLSKARRLLGWSPHSHELLEATQPSTTDGDE